MSAAARRRSSPSASRLGRSGAKSSAAATVTEATPSSARPSGNHANGAGGVHGGGVQCQKREGAARRGVGRDHRGQSRPGGEHGHEGEREGTAENGPGACERAREAGHAVAHGEGRPGPPEHARQRPADDRLLDVEPLEQVQDAEDAEQGQCDGQGPAAATRELPCGAEEGKPGGEGQRMGQGDLVDGRDGQDGTQPRRDRGGERGGNVDDPDQGGRAGREHRHALVHRCGRQIRGPVQPRPPHGRVARGRVQVAPVLHHQPGAGGEQHGERGSAHLGQREHPAGEQRGEAEVAFVQPPPEHEQPRAERVALDAGDARDRSGRHGPIVQSAPLARLCVGVGIVLASRRAGLAPALGARLP